MVGCCSYRLKPSLLLKLYWEENEEEEKKINYISYSKYVQKMKNKKNPYIQNLYNKSV